MHGGSGKPINPIITSYSKTMFHNDHIKSAKKISVDHHLMQKHTVTSSQHLLGLSLVVTFKKNANSIWRTEHAMQELRWLHLHRRLLVAGFHVFWFNLRLTTLDTEIVLK